MRRTLTFTLASSLVFACTREKPPERTSVAAPPSAEAPLGSAAVAAEPPKPAPKRPYNVILIMVDSLRADMPWSGYSRPIAPWLTEFEKKSVSYTRGYSLSSYTAKSVAPALVGKYPSEMERDGYFFTRWLPENLFVTERLQKAGMRTMAGNGHGYFLPNMGLNQGFDDYRLLPGTFLDLTGVHDITSEAMNKQAKEMLSDPANVKLPEGKRFFAYFHFLDPHYVYFKHEGHPDFGDRRRDLYDNEVHYTDHWVGDLVDWAYEQPWGPETAVIITADHGEGFGEHGQYRHAYEIWESLVHVPWFIHVPGAPAHRIETPRGHIDLAPTVADLMGVAAEPPFRGVSLLPEVFGEEAKPRPVIVDLPRCDLMDRRRALIWNGYKLLAFGDDYKFMLFDLDHDPNEEHDLASKEPERLAEMKKLYQELSDGIPKTPVTGGVALKGARPSQRY